MLNVGITVGSVVVDVMQLVFVKVQLCVIIEVLELVVGTVQNAVDVVVELNVSVTVDDGEYVTL